MDPSAQDSKNNIDILVQLAALKERFVSLETQLVNLSKNLSEWNANHQAAALKVQDLESRLKALESSNNDRRGREWDVAKSMLPHIATWVALGLYVYFKTKV